MKNQAGFSLLELLVVFGVLMTLLTIATLNLFNLSNRTYQSKAYTTLVSDIKSQQVKAMNGDTNNLFITSSYGVYFETDKYTLFKGNTFSPTDPSNFEIDLPNDAHFANITFIDSQVVFASGSGEFISYSSSHNSLQIQDKSNNTVRAFSLNRFGIVTSN